MGIFWDLIQQDELQKQEDKLIINIISVGHRKNVYK